MSEVDAWDPHRLKDIPSRQRDDALPDFFYWLRISQHAHEMGVDMVSVESMAASCVKCCAASGREI
jgi:hypothetical protein